MMDAGSRTYANLIEKQDIDSHKDNSFDKLHIRTLKSSASLKLLHEDFLEKIFKTASGVYISSVM